LALKRAIAYAAENGYDKIAWTTGEQQADRYDLSKTLQKVTAIKSGDGFNIRGVDTSGNGHDFGTHPVDKLADVVGKDLAEKIAQQKTPNEAYAGNDLKVGGEGMKGYYDQIVPQVAKKLGAQVETVELPMLQPGKHERGGVVYDSMYSDTTSNVPAPNSKQPGFDITPEMRKQVATTGLPLFAKKDDVLRAGLKTIDIAKTAVNNLLDDVLMKTAPMSVSTASDTARAVAKDYANAERAARWQWAQFDNVLKKNFTEPELVDMWNAADEENLLRSKNETSDTLGINRLPPQQREVVDTLHQYGEELMQRARDSGMFSGEGVPYWTPRMAVMIGEDGEYARPTSGVKGEVGGPQGRNISTTASSLKQRKYLTSEETEAAMQAKLDTDGKTAQLVRNIRTMPMAMARLERAIAGRELINQIRDIGARTGMETTSSEEGPGFFTIDHPAFKTFTPRENWTPVSMRELLDKNYQVQDGQVVRPDPNTVNGYLPVKGYRVDASGDLERRDTVFEKTPIYVSKDFEGPLKAIMSEKSGAIYQAFMAFKAKTMSVIMYSPLIHNAVEWGRALPMMPGKVLTFRVYFEGNAFKNDPQQMRQAILDGLSPIGGHGGTQDITGIMEDPTLTPGRSLTAKILGGAAGLVHEGSGLAVKKAIDAAGDVWHETLLWDRVADLQAGIYKNAKDEFMAKGVDARTAGIIAAHMANRFAGALPNEAMSAMARKTANFLLFSRTFTLGNLGVMKDMVTGLPKDVQAQILQNSGEAVRQTAVGIARRTAAGAFMMDLALMYAANSVLQDVFAHFKQDESWGDLAQAYVDRAHAAMQNLVENPLAIAAPFDLAQSLTANSQNEPGKEGRIRYGTDDNGTAIYVRLPTGKIGEEFEGWLSSPLDMIKRKLGTVARPIIQTATNDRGFGRQVYDPNAAGLGGVVKNLGRIVWNFMAQQIPIDSATSVYDLATGHANDTDAMKAFGPLAGLTFSKGAPGGPAMGEIYYALRNHENAVQAAMPDISRALKLGDTDKAVALMQSVQMTPREIAGLLNKSANPQARMSKYMLRQFMQHASAADVERFQQLAK
ncbi:MAG TPA: hypothetical protein VMV33_07610, partial [Rhodocyclaceae bacterium]|nr:hypothetical protein [Rhodocyclaceae bacterium]